MKQYKASERITYLREVRKMNTMTAERRFPANGRAAREDKAMTRAQNIREAAGTFVLLFVQIPAILAIVFSGAQLGLASKGMDTTAAGIAVIFIGFAGAVAMLCVVIVGIFCRRSRIHGHIFASGSFNVFSWMLALTGAFFDFLFCAGCGYLLTLPA